MNTQCTCCGVLYNNVTCPRDFFLYCQFLAKKTNNLFISSYVSIIWIIWNRYYDIIVLVLHLMMIVCENTIIIFTIKTIVLTKGMFLIYTINWYALAKSRCETIPKTVCVSQSLQVIIVFVNLHSWKMYSQLHKL